VCGVFVDLTRAQYSKTPSAVLTEAGIIDACFELLQNPQETTENKRVLRKLCDEWARETGASHTDMSVDVKREPSLMAKRRASQEAAAAQETSTVAPARCVRGLSTIFSQIYRLMRAS
jgi:hypothetical protein